ncbi:putative membrane protein SirB2 [Pseudomonas fluvialis]|uniref:Putative membrane protein SirB2 n=1 Tax=Pseudomonas fluvialis TaxID=1793966 RepID=A0A7X0BTC2_9PSED|nr:SirB2 family protein [Pseudomonas fluvialis]MBB6342504.1 putative membrane protein SirB2 [Pseudomonas fluvialis]
MYLVLKSLHVGLALASIGLFGWRLWRSWQSQSQRTPSWVHGIDSLLLLSAGLLIWQAMPWPLPDWLQLKIAVLVLYIALAALALRRAPGSAKVLLSLACALSIAAILALARLKPF